MIPAPFKQLLLVTAFLVLVQLFKITRKGF